MNVGELREGGGLIGYRNISKMNIGYILLSAMRVSSTCKEQEQKGQHFVRCPPRTHGQGSTEVFEI